MVRDALCGWSGLVSCAHAVRASMPSSVSLMARRRSGAGVRPGRRVNSVRILSMAQRGRMAGEVGGFSGWRGPGSQTVVGSGDGVVVVRGWVMGGRAERAGHRNVLTLH